LNELRVFQEASAKGFNEYSKGVLINYRAVIPPKWAIIACVVMIVPQKEYQYHSVATDIVRIVADSNANSGSITE
jgi:hypothetical protein